MTKTTKEEFDRQLQDCIASLRMNADASLITKPANEFKDCFVDMYLRLLTDIEDNEYRRQRAITAFNWTLKHYERYTRKKDEQERFIAALSHRLSYDFQHPEPLAPSFVYWVLERMADFMENHPILCALSVALAIVSTATFMPFIISLHLTAVASVAIILTAYLIGGTIGNLLLGRPDFTVLSKFDRTDENTILCNSDHEINAKQDVHLRPWSKHGLFFSPKTITSDTTELLEPINALSN